MKMNMVERSVAVLVGMAAGFVLWLAGITALTAIVPMQHIIIAGAAFLGLMIIVCLALANHFKKSERRTIALAFWCAPTLSVIASIYSLIVLLN
jgi:hypothetical protein